MIVYLHGLDSSGRSHKVGVLRRALAPRPLLAPDYPAHRPHAAVAMLSDWFARLAPRTAGGAGLILVGSSMGGFYGQYLARHLRQPVAHLCLINPALHPWDLFPPYIGQVRTDAQGETYRVTAQLIEATRAFGILDPCDGVPTTVFLDAGDEIIDATIAQRIYRDCADVNLYPGGDHAFQHLEQLIDCLRSLA
jgi:predicted esterase YcpF (UPF0227 family)